MNNEPNAGLTTQGLTAEHPVFPKQRQIEHDIDVGNRMRSRMLVRAVTRFWRWITMPFRPVPSPDQIEPAANALAAIRSAVEILRDTPDLDARERRRFAEIILHEEGRLEALLDDWRGRRVRST